MRRFAAAVWIVLALGAWRGAACEDLGLVVYRTMGIKAGDVLNGSVLSSQVLPGRDKQVVALVTYMTGKKDEANAVNVRLEVFRRQGDVLESVYARDYGKENGGYVGRGEIQTVDLDGDGVQEIFVTYDLAKDRLIEDRRGEIVVRDGDAFRVQWVDAVQYDATRAARDVPADRRDRFVRELDLAGTMRTKGVSLLFDKKTIAVAGERLADPKVTKEAIPFRRAAEVPVAR